LGVAPKSQKQKRKRKGKHELNFFSKFLFFFYVIEDGKEMNKKGERRKEKNSEKIKRRS
jgi:hypothetical protein